MWPITTLGWRFHSIDDEIWITNDRVAMPRNVRFETYQATMLDDLTHDLAIISNHLFMAFNRHHVPPDKAG